MAAATAMLDEHHNPLQQNSRDHNTYTLGRIGRHNVVVACLPTGVMGTVSAARVADQMLRTFEEIRFGLVVGIGGGVPSEENDIRLGDIVVSKPIKESGGVIQYDFGKTVQEGRFKRTGSLNRPPDMLLTALASLQSKHMRERPELMKYLSEMLRRYPKMVTQFARPDTQHDLLYDAEYDHITEQATCSQCNTSKLIDREPRPSEDPFIHYGLIASGDQVMRHGATRERLRKELDVLCFEMEAAGLMDDFPCLVVRGICDYADSHKNKLWQGYAAATAAAYAKELLSVIPGNLVGIPTAVETTKTSYQGSEFEESPKRFDYGIIFLDRANIDRSVVSEAYCKLVRTWTQHYNGVWRIEFAHSAGYCIKSGSDCVDLTSKAVEEMHSGIQPPNKIAMDALFDNNRFQYPSKQFIKHETEAKRSQGITKSLFRTYDYILVFDSQSFETVRKLKEIFKKELGQSIVPEGKGRIVKLGDFRYDSHVTNLWNPATTGDDKADREKWNAALDKIKISFKNWLRKEMDWTEPAH